MNTAQFFKKINWTRIFSILMIANFLINLLCVSNEIREMIRASKTSSISTLSEFLINWKGGYVRRGLIGELLFRLCEVTGWQPMPIIISLCIISYVVFAIVFFVMLKKENICWWIMFLPFTIGGMPVVRKDYICFLFVLLILYLLKTTFKFLWVKLLCIYTVSCFLLHIHEAFFFVIVPFVVLYLYFHEFSTWSSKIAKFIFAAVPLVVPFLLICRCHGDNNTAQIIHASWVKTCSSLTEYRFHNSDCIGAIGWTTVHAIKFHLRLSFLLHEPFVLLLIYYLMSRYLLIFNDKCQEITKKQSVLNAVLQFQFIMLIPLFTILSCDADRICAYWTISSICIYCIFESEIFEILSGKKIVLDTTKKIDSLFDCVLKPSKVLLCFLILFVTVKRVGNWWTFSSVYNAFVRCAETILHNILHGFPH